jgi:hypothetical protein
MDDNYLDFITKLMKKKKKKRRNIGGDVWHRWMDELNE